MMETIYVAQGKNGLLKVGRTLDPKRRLCQLRKEFSKKGDPLARFALCEPTTDGHRAEYLLLLAVRERLARHSGEEWFHGGLFENAERAANEISDYVRETSYERKRKTQAQNARERERYIAAMAQNKAEYKARRALVLQAEIERREAKQAKKAADERRNMAAFARMVAILTPVSTESKAAA